MTNLINWSEVSRLLTSDRTHIRANYSGKRYKKQIDELKNAVKEWEDKVKKGSKSDSKSF